MYTIERVKTKNTCQICDDKKTINYKGKDLKCPECMGEGKVNSGDMEYIVADEYSLVRSAIITINDYDTVHVKYKVRRGIKKMTKSDGMVFKTKEDAQKRCGELNIVRETLSINHIEIQERFARFEPAREKLQRKLLHYVENKKFDKPIVVGSDGVLRDGYVNYLICKMLEIDTVEVVVDDSIELVPVK